MADLSNKRFDDLERRLRQRTNGGHEGVEPWVAWIEQTASDGERLCFARWTLNAAQEAGNQKVIDELVPVVAELIELTNDDRPYNAGDGLTVYSLLERLPDDIKPDWQKETEAQIAEVRHVHSYRGRETQQAISALVDEGLEDATIADRLGLFEQTVWAIRETIEWRRKRR